MDEQLLARRARKLATVFPKAHFPSELASNVIAFDSGFAASELLPDLLPFAARALSTQRQETLQYSASQGQPDLREWIAGHMRADGSGVTADNLMIVNGAKQGLDLLCRLLIDEGDAIVVTAPTYFTAIPIFRSFGVEFIEAPQDQHGLQVEALDAQLRARRAAGKPRPKFIYNVADFHNPIGMTMSESRRRQLIELAALQGTLIIEDSPYRRVRFSGPSVPTLKALDTTDCVIHVGTFSKLIAPGLRIGWIAAATDVITRLIQLKSDGGTSPLLQRIVCDFCRSPLFETHSARVRQHYAQKRDRMVAAIQRELTGVGLLIPDGGYYVWLTLPGGMDGDEFAQRAASLGVNLIAGSRFFANTGPERDPPLPRNHVRLSYSFASVEQIDEGLRRLADVYRSLAT